MGVDISTLSESDSWKPDLNIQARMKAPRNVDFQPLHILENNYISFKLGENTITITIFKLKVKVPVVCWHEWKCLTDEKLMPNDGADALATLKRESKKKKSFLFFSGILSELFITNFN